ncbi:ABC transporter permease [Cohnella silvisoli]|uniref:ABC transporter permease subunit n=1 Tax=Cohnella silvisoli TaxID=2873699 RepID=A0ABV1KWG2_9BACL|nr:ABC transporter permease subunit [Cohnella silvisoli]MCD9023718.1 ABC transporter permease subunit [Cohnella silvisoli]
MAHYSQTAAQTNALDRLVTNKVPRGAFKKIRRHWQLYILISAPLLYFILFKYVPMLGVQIAFKDLNAMDGIWGSPWAGFKHFQTFFEHPNFWNLIRNTLVISLYSLIVGFPAPIILAIALNELKNGVFKRAVQLITYAPYFISTVVMASMIILFLSPRIGLIDHIRTAFGFESINFIAKPSMFSSIFVLSDVWQFMGYGAIIYIAALAGVNTQLYEAAKIDGASRLQKIIHIDLPSILPIMVLLLVLNMGQLLNVGFEKVYLLQNPLNVGTSEIISTYVYKIGLVQANYSFSAAVGLFNSFINLLLVLVANFTARRVTGSGLF